MMTGTRAALLVAVACTLAPAAEERRPLNVHDMIAMERVSSPVPSPDGRWVAFEVRSYSLESNRGAADLWLAAVDGSEVRRLTTSDAQDHSPTWLRDPLRLALLSTRSGSSQIWTIAPDGGEATQLAELPVDVETIKASPDGSRLALSARVYVDCADLACTADRDRERQERGVDARIHDALLYRHWDRWEDGKRSHVFVLVPGGEPVDLMAGMDSDCPSLPFGGAEEYDWLPGGEIVFTAKTDPHPERSTNFDLFRSAAGASPQRLTGDNPAWDTAPTLSPDGRHLAWLAMERPGYESDRFRVMLLDLRDGSRRPLATTWDRSPGSLAWAADSRALLATADNGGKRPLYRIPLAGGDPAPMVADGFQASPAGLLGGGAVFTRDRMTAPAEIWAVADDGSGLRALTRLNNARLAGLLLPEPQEFWFPGAGGDRVHGWYLPPAVPPAAGARVPLAFLIHGGPQGSWTDHFHYRWNPQAYTGAGYAVAMVDFHGSTGYGQAFTDAIRGDWGGKPFDDLMRGLDHVLAQHPEVDPERVCALGASYGGYMVNWIAGHSDRFRCLVNHDGIFDLRSMYFTTEELWFPEWDLGGTPWEQPEAYRRWSPSSYVESWKTPMLVVHGGRDFRVVDGEGLSTFTALQRRGIESQLLYFPDENHWVLKPRNTVLWHDTVLGWLERFLKN